MRAFQLKEYVRPAGLELLVSHQEAPEVEAL